MEMGGITRGDLVIAAIAGDYGKPRPNVVVQADGFAALGSVTLLPLTSEVLDLPPVRITIQPTQRNGLRSTSQIMIDKIATVTRRKIRQRIGRVEDALMRRVDAALARFLGLE
jgi:mRNA interferase MazF